MDNYSVAHVEFPAANAKESADFYKQLFGWNINTVPSPTGDYFMYTPSAGPGGGFNPVSDGGDGNMPVKPGEVIVYFNTSDIDATLARVEALGGKTVMPKSPIPGMGYFALFSDLTNNRVGLFTTDPTATM